MNEYFANQGFISIDVYGLCPVQLEANHSQGFSIYFRARGQYALFEVYNLEIKDVLPDDKHLIFSQKIRITEKPYKAGYIDIDYVFYIFYCFWVDLKDFLV